MTQQILCTMDYSIFKNREFNRDIREPHVEKLKTAIQKKNLLHVKPIFINENFEIIDGQHRLKAAKDLNVPIYYTILPNLGCEDMALLDANVATWKIGDFLNFYASIGNENYIKLKEKLSGMNIPITTSLNLMPQKNSEFLNKFKNGEYIFKETQLFEYANKIIETIDILKLQKEAAKIKFTHTSKFWRAMLWIMTRPSFKFNIWKEKVEMQANKICAKASIQDYKNLFLSIYNYKNRVNVIVVNMEGEEIAV